MAEHNELGTKGEDAAVEYLQKQSHEILARNYRYRKAEVDIISKDGKFIVFTEVKVRSTNAFGSPQEFVTKQKRQLIRQAAEEYLYQNKLDTDVRFDIISINHKKGRLEIVHIKDAFFHE